MAPALRMTRSIKEKLPVFFCTPRLHLAKFHLKRRICFLWRQEFETECGTFYYLFSSTVDLLAILRRNRYARFIDNIHIHIHNQVVNTWYI